MNHITTLYTPGTGLPDFEMRIALGISAAALNAVEPEKVKLIQLDDRYCVEINDDNDDSEATVARSLSWICANKLADENSFGRLPGVHTRWYKAQAKNVANFGKWLSKNPTFPAAMKEGRVISKAGATSSACGHPYDATNEVFTALLVLSPHIGKPPVRNNIQNVKNLPICPYCGVLALAGAIIYQISLSVQKTDDSMFFLPRFSGVISGVVLSKYLAATKQLQNSLYDIPASAGLLVLLGHYPNVVNTLYGETDCAKSFFVSRYEAEKAGARYGKLSEQSVRNEKAFLLYSTYNRALIQRCYRMDEARSELLGLLSRALQNHDEKAALDFARNYVGATDGKMLLPWATTRFYALEVIKMDKMLLEGEKFKIIKETADMLQYFVKERNFGYVDNLRKARDADEFAKLLLDAQREAQSVMLDPKKQFNKPYLPGQVAIKNLLQMINEDAKQFKSIQTLVALMAFTYYKKEA